MHVYVYIYVFMFTCMCNKHKYRDMYDIHICVWASPGPNMGVYVWPCLTPLVQFVCHGIRQCGR